MAQASRRVRHRWKRTAHRVVPYRLGRAPWPQGSRWLATAWVLTGSLPGTQKSSEANSQLQAATAADE